MTDLLTQLQNLFNSGNLSEDDVKEKLLKALEVIPEEHKKKLKEENIDITEMILNYLKSNKGGKADTEQDIKNKIKNGFYLIYYYFLSKLSKFIFKKTK